MATINPEKAKQKFAFKTQAVFRGLALDPLRPFLYAGGDDNAVHVFDLKAEKKEAVATWQKHDNYVSAVVCPARGGRAVPVSGGFDRRLVWWDAESGKPSREVEAAHEGWVRDLQATPDGNLLVSVGDDMLVKVWETDTGKPVRTMAGHATRSPQGHVTALYCVAISADGRHVASADRIGEVRVWELATGKGLQVFQVPVLYTYDERQRKRSIGGIRSITFSSDGASIAVGGIGQVGNVDGLAGPATVEVWDWQKPARRFTAGVQGHKAILNDLHFAENDAWLIGVGGGSDNGVLAFWKTDPMPDGSKNDKPPEGQRQKTDGHLHRFCLNPAGDELYAAGHRKLEVWSLGG